MGRHDELRIGKNFHQIDKHPLLPARMQVQIHFVDHHHGLGFNSRRASVRIGLSHAAREVHDKRQERAVTIAQLIQRQ